MNLITSILFLLANIIFFAFLADIFRITINRLLLSGEPLERSLLWLIFNGVVITLFLIYRAGKNKMRRRN